MSAGMNSPSDSELEAPRTNRVATPLRAFVSSTYRDLREHRARAIDELRECGFFVDPMEDWTADTAAPARLCRERAAACDVFVVLVGSRLGFFPQGEDRSITQLEYEAARRAGVDVFVYLLEEQAFPPCEIDPHEAENLHEWREELKKNHTVGFFDLDPASLQLAPALVRWASRRKREDGQVWNVPHHRNPLFTGREEILAALHRGQDVWGTRHVLAGPGGIGKTQIAVEFACRNAARYDIVWWIGAEDRALFLQGLSHLGVELGLPIERHTGPGALSAVVAWLASHRHWLLILDNVARPSDVDSVLPARYGHILITTRDSTWPTGYTVTEVRPWPRRESVEFLLARCSDRDRHVADLVAQELADFPLALEQAAGYVEATAGNLGEFRNLYRVSGERLRAHEASPNCPMSVAATLNLSLNRIRERSPGAAALLEMLSFVAPDAFPFSCLASSAKHLPEELRIAMTTGVGIADIRAALRSHSLARFLGDEVSVHPMVQAVVRDLMPEERISGNLDGLLQLLWEALRPGPPEARTPDPDRLLPHALTVARHVEALMQYQDYGAPDAPRLGWESAAFLSRLLCAVGKRLAQTGETDQGGVLLRRARELMLKCDMYGWRVHLVAEIEQILSDLDSRSPTVRRAASRDRGGAREESQEYVEFARAEALLAQAESLEATKEAVERFRSLSTKAADLSREGFAKSLRTLATRLARAGRLDEAVDAEREAVGVYRSLHRELKWKYQPYLALALGQAACLLQDAGRNEEALASALEAFELWEELASADESIPILFMIDRTMNHDFKPQLIRTKLTVSTCLGNLKSFAEAATTASEAIEIALILAEEEESYLSLLGAHLSNRGQYLFEMGDATRAVALLKDALKVLSMARPINAEWLRNTLEGYESVLEKSGLRPHRRVIAKVNAVLAKDVGGTGTDGAGLLGRITSLLRRMGRTRLLRRIRGNPHR